MKIAVLGTGRVGRTVAERLDDFATWQAEHPAVRLVDHRTCWPNTSEPSKRCGGYGPTSTVSAGRHRRDGLLELVGLVVHGIAPTVAETSARSPGR